MNNDVHPHCKPMFASGMKTQGKFLVGMIQLSLNQLANPEKFNGTLVKLAEVHNERGVKAVEYGIVGSVMFWTLEQCLGLTVWNEELATAWIKIFSKMLAVMVPIALAHEMKDGSAQNQRVTS